MRSTSRSFGAALALAGAAAAGGGGAPVVRPPSDSTLDPFGIAAGPAPGAACAAAEFRQFDFWVGTWEVVTPAGAPSGVNVVSRELGGCAVEERWTDGGGGRGRSLNAYDPADRRWHQHWVFAAGGPGSVVHYAGRFTQGRMVLGGTRAFPSGVRLQDLGIWTQLAPDSVRQEFYTLFSDTTGPQVFDGRYLRRHSVTAAAERAFPTCGGRPRNHDLDFTIGSWEVRVAEGGAGPGGAAAAAGRSEIRADLGHCLLEERFTGRGGYEALGYGAYSPVSQRWEYTRADSRGVRVFLEATAAAAAAVGAPATGPITMRGRSPRPADSAAAAVRVVWEPAGPGSFRQRWETSADGGTTWVARVVAVYVKR